ncbi:MAG: TetR family transcriptional regulator [Dehalococcoidia bacterium]|nr:MAG: TetR family transcriptional regulator [Dehalococcoidia bacterium]
MLEQPLDRRQQILGAVASCVSEEGMGAVTLRNVARRIGATTGMLTHYYANRTALLKDVATSAEAALHTRIARRPTLDQHDGWLCALFEESLAPSSPGTLPWGFWLEYWASAERDPELGKHSMERLDALRREVEDCVRAGIEDGTFRGDLDVRDAAQTIVAFMHGLGMELAVRHERLDTRTRGLFVTLLDGFRAP